jgi:hypothetical protein
MAYGTPKARVSYQTADAQVYTGACRLLGLCVIAGSAAVHDDTSAGTAANRVVVTPATTPGVWWFGDGGLRCGTGIHLDLTTGPVIVYYTID